MHVDLSQAALPVTGRRRSPLPRGITAAEARALLGAVTAAPRSVGATTR